MSMSGSESLPLGLRGLVHMAHGAIPEVCGPFPFVLINPVLCFSPEHLHSASPLMVSFQGLLGRFTSCFELSIWPHPTHPFTVSFSSLGSHRNRQGAAGSGQPRLASVQGLYLSDFRASCPPSPPTHISSII